MRGQLFRLSEGDFKFIASEALQTPIRSSSALDAQIGRTIRIKDETVQRSVSFKFRGVILGVRNAS
jgi:threonine dehydratase